MNPFVSAILLTVCSCHLIGGKTVAQTELPAFPWEFQRIAQLQSDLPQARLSEFKAATISPDGTVLVTTSRFAGFHRFASDGEWLGNLEREGEGPGEFRFVTDLTVGSHGSIYIYDVRLQRLSIFDSSDDYKNSFRLENGPNGTTTRMVEAGEEALWIAHRRLRGNPDTGESASELFELKLLSSAGEELWALQAEIKPSQLAVFGQRGGTAIPVANPADREIVWAASPDGDLWLFRQDIDELIHMDYQANEISRIGFSLAPTVLTDDYWTHFKQTAVRWDPAMERLGIQDMRKPLRDLLDQRRDRVNQVQGISYVGEKGLLVNRSLYHLGTTGDQWALEPGWFACITLDGRMTRSVEGPGGLVAAAFGYVLCLESERGEVPRLSLWRLVPKS